MGIDMNTKKCSKCGVKFKTKSTGSYCTDCNREYRRRWYDKNKKRVAEYERKRYKEDPKVLSRIHKYKAENKEKRRESGQEYYKKNKDRIKKYYKDNREDYYARASLREYRTVKSTPKYPYNCSSEISQLYKEIVIITQKTGENHHLDHIWPVSKGGVHHPINMQILTEEENLKKHASHDGEIGVSFEEFELMTRAYA